VRRGSPSDTIQWSSSRPWWERFDLEAAEYLSWEADAYRAQEWASLRIPDLLYTPEYTRALFRADRVFCAEHLVGTRWDDAGARRIRDEIDSRIQRQDRLSGQKDRPLVYTTVVEEAALRKVVGSPSIMRTQLLELLDYAGCNSVTLRVMPERTTAQAGTDGGFRILEFNDPLMKPLLFMHYPGGVVVEEELRVLQRAQQRFDAVLAAALPEPHSAELIEQLADVLYPA
jgi:hypothetical protein